MNAELYLKRNPDNKLVEPHTTNKGILVNEKALYYYYKVRLFRSTPQSA